MGPSICREATFSDGDEENSIPFVRKEVCSEHRGLLTTNFTIRKVGAMLKLIFEYTKNITDLSSFYA